MVTLPPLQPRALLPGQAGFSYLFLLFFIAILGASLAAISDVWMTRAIREKESELLFIGNEYRLAIARYYEYSSGPYKHYPASLEDLLLDPRFPEVRRYLRARYPDPFGSDWVILPAPQGGIMGIASAAQEHPLKTSGFFGANSVFEPLGERLGDELRYRDWEFVYSPSQRALVKP